MTTKYTILRRVDHDAADMVSIEDNYMSAMDQLLILGPGHFCETPDGDWIHADGFERERPSEARRAGLFRKLLSNRRGNR